MTEKEQENDMISDRLNQELSSSNQRKPGSTGLIVKDKNKAFNKYRIQNRPYTVNHDAPEITGLLDRDFIPPHLANIHPAPFTTKTEPLELARRGQLRELKAVLPALNLNGLNQQNEKGRTPLFVACLNGKIETMLTIIDAGSDGDSTDFLGKSVIFYAIAKRNLECIKALIKKGVNLNLVDNNGRTPLMEAAMDSNLAAVKELLKAGVDIHAKDNKGRTALMYATAKGKLDVINELKLAGSNVKERDRTGKAVIQYGLTKNNFDDISICLSEEVDIHSPLSHYSFLHSTSSRNSSPSSSRKSKKSKKMIDRSISPAGSIGSNEQLTIESSTRSVKSVTPFVSKLCSRNCHELVRNSDYNALDVLLQAANHNGINETDKKGRTALMIACIQQKSTPFEMILNAGADIHIKDKLGMTALIFAISTNNLEFIYKLLAAGASIHTSDNEGRTPLIHAVLKGDLKTTKELIGAGARVNDKDAFGRTALFYAAAKGDLTMMELLLNFKANILIIDNEGFGIDKYCASCKNNTAVHKLIVEEKIRQISIKNAKLKSIEDAKESLRLKRLADIEETARLKSLMKAKNAIKSKSIKSNSDLINQIEETKINLQSQKKSKSRFPNSNKKTNKLKSLHSEKSHKSKELHHSLSETDKNTEVEIERTNKVEGEEDLNLFPETNGFGYWRSRRRGKTVIEIVEAKDLPKLDFFSHTDCYVNAMFSGDLKSNAEPLRTPVISDNLNPKFHHQITFPFVPHESEKICFSLVDDDLFGRSDVIGTADIEFTKLRSFKDDICYLNVVLDKAVKEIINTLLGIRFISLEYGV